MQVIVTRPMEDAQAWLARLQSSASWPAHGWQSRLWPLIDIRLLDDDAVRVMPSGALDGSEAPPEWDAVMFVSANAVRFLARSTAARGGGLADCLMAAGRRSAQAWAVGPSTVAALVTAGWPAAAIVAPDDHPSGQFDSEALWARVEADVRSGRVRQVLMVRGTDAGAGGQPVGRDWLTMQLLAQGVRVDQVAVYERSVPSWSPVLRAAARAALTDGSVWLISSGQAAGHLAQLMASGAIVAPKETAVDAVFARARCVATHPRVVQRLQADGWGHVVLSRPEPEAVVASIKSIAYAR